MPTNALEVSLPTDFQTCLIAGSVLPQIARFAPSFGFFFTFIGGTHGFPGNALRMADVLCGPLPSLLMDQIQITESRLSAGLVLKKERLRGKLVGAGNRIVARISNISCSVSFELIFTELE